MPRSSVVSADRDAGAYSAGVLARPAVGVVADGQMPTLIGLIADGNPAASAPSFAHDPRGAEAIVQLTKEPTALTVEMLMTAAPVTITPGATLRDAVDLLTKIGVSALPVTEGDTVVGLVSAQSIVAFAAATPGVPTERDVSDIWEEPATNDDDVPSVEYFADLWDDAGPDLVERFRTSDTPEWDVLSEHLVEDAMTRNPPRVAPSATARSAASLMRTTGSHGVLVIDDGLLCGIVTTMDIARAVSRGQGM